MVADPLKVAVIGVGHLGSQHARVYSGMDEVKLVAVADIVPEKAKEIAREYETQAIADFRELIDGDLRPDAVSVVVPTRAHAEVGIPFLEAGIAALVEKPMADTLEEADALIEAARKGKATLQVGHIERFNPAIRAIRKTVRDPRFIESDRIAPFQFRSTDIGVVLDLMIHDIDIILSFFDEPVTHVDALGACILSDKEDIATVRLVFGDRSVAHCKASRIALKTVRKIRIFQDDCYISLDYGARQGLIYRKKPEFSIEQIARVAEESSKPEDVVGLLFSKFLTLEEVSMTSPEEPLQSELDAFLKAVRDGSEPEVTGKDGRQAMEVAGKILDQIRRRWDRKDPTV
ncbi:MAG: Gfo/Idh/MocA family oxidoreductase [Planctomycetota bacterium]|nr:Gfo/Idh/MocA family oxidoreductase [Planctomycetota bacterium]